MSPVWCLCEQRPPEPGKMLCWLCDQKIEDAASEYEAQQRLWRRRRRAANLGVCGPLFTIFASGAVVGWVLCYLYTSF